MLTEVRWISMEDAAKYLGVSVKTVRRRIADGTVAAQKIGPRLIRVDANSLQSAGAPVTERW